jgi:rare lipoprotein A
MEKHIAVKFMSFLTCALVFFCSCLPKLAQASFSYQRDQIQLEVKSLSEEVELVQSECDAIDSRLNAFSKLMAKNCIELGKAESRCLTEKEKFNARLRDIYKNGDIGLMEVLLNVKDFEDFLLRVSYLQKINESDLELFDSYSGKKEEIVLLRKDLEKSKLETLNLKRQKLERLSELKNKLAEKQHLLDQANSELQMQIKKAEEGRKNKKQEIIANSVPLGFPVKVVSCKVFPYLNDAFVTSERLPSSYRATGVIFSGVASWYGNEFNGEATASGEVFNENDFTCASRTLAFGTYLGVTYGDKRIVVKVTDRGPFIEGRILDLSKAAAQALGISGIGTVKIEVLEPENI